MVRRLLNLTAALIFGAVVSVGAQVFGSTQLVSAQGADCTTANACAIYTAIPTGAVTVALQVSGTWSGTLTFEASSDGMNWVSVMAIPVSTGTAATTTTAVGIFVIKNSGYAGVRARASAWTSGTAIVVANGGKFAH